MNQHSPALPPKEDIDEIIASLNKPPPLPAFAPPCRDFLRRSCTRSFGCKFFHGWKFCHDFQNRRGCHRAKCHFLHATLKDMLIYRGTGKLSQTLLVEVQRTLQNETNICRNFMNKAAKCEKADCKFRHMEVEDTKEIVCKVCYERIVSGTLRFFSHCNHVFCHSCCNSIEFDRFFQSACPYCRRVGDVIEVS